MRIEKDNTEKWNGIYKGVNFEICKFISNYEHKEHWTFYLYLSLDRIPVENKPNSYWLKPRKDEKFPNYIYYDYYKHPVISSIDFHCGCTWYSKEKGFDGDRKVIKIGCDYSHFYDERNHYTIDILTNDVQKSIDSFLNFVPGYKYKCCGNGKLYNLSEGIVKDGYFCSREYWEKGKPELFNI
jgi:hypothetical protein